MRKNNIKRICILALVVFTAGAMISGCKDKKKKIKYGKTEGVVSGSITIDEEELDIKIDNVIAEAGSDIDYTSGIEVEGDGEYSVDVNASNVRYDTPGTYTATYNVTSGNKTYSEDIKVTIKDNKNKKEEPDSSEMKIENQNNQEVNQSGNNGAGIKPNSPETTAKQNNSQGGGNTKPTNNQSGGSIKPTNPPATKPTGNQSGTNKETTSKRVLITEEKTTTYKNVSIGNSSIELLSGDVVTIKCSTNKYIVETKTVESEITKGGHKYKVTKLVVVFNTGAEQTIETIEKRID